MFNIFFGFILSVALGVVLLYNKVIIQFIARSAEKSERLFFRHIGIRMRKWNTLLDRRATIKKGRLYTKFYNYFREMIVNLGMARYNVTPIGLFMFILALSFAITLLVTFIFQGGSLFFVTYIVILYLIIVIFRFVSIVRFEKKEAEIMDTEDLIAMDIGGGVYNAIVRYRNSFHPNVRPHFDEMIDNIRNKGYSFNMAIKILNDKLGHSFTDFANKAIQYEHKADKDMVEIFSTVVEKNRHKRETRNETNRKFNNLRNQYILSLVIISLYGLFSTYNDPYMYNFFFKSTVGKMVLLFNVVFVTAILGYITTIKSKFL